MNMIGYDRERDQVHRLEWQKDKWILAPTFGFTALVVAMCFPEVRMVILIAIVTLICVWAVDRAERYGVDGFLLRYGGKSFARRLLACTLLFIGATICVVLGVPVEGT